jgi:preprotein translocase subunit SecD
MKLSIRIWILIIALIFSLLAIKPSFDSGVIITSIEPNSSIIEQGIKTGEIIKSINGETISSKQDYSRVSSSLILDNQEKRIDIQTNDNNYIIFSNGSIGITVDSAPRSRIQTGLDLRGGARALVQPDVEISDSELDDLVDIARNRFNIYGLSDVNIKGVTDLSGDKFLLIEIAGATPADLEQLVSQQGKFEAQIANQTVFVGGKDKDIRDVCRNDATCAFVSSCLPLSASQGLGETSCSFQFTIYLSEEAAQRHADITSNISLDETGQYLTESLFLYVDDKEVDSLLISSSLRGQTTTQISIQGSGSGPTADEALQNARTDMRRLQTILLTGSLPYKLNIVRLDTISPTLGNEFTKSILLAGLASIMVVSIIIFIRYGRIKASLALLLTAFSELFIILGVASFIGWNLDLPSIAGILATIGTGVDQQIVIIDEAVKSKTISIRQKMKRALFVILTAYITSVVALIPLYRAGAGLFKGFALTTIIGITAGVLITRPAFADIIGKIEE